MLGEHSAPASDRVDQPAREQGADQLAHAKDRDERRGLCSGETEIAGEEQQRACTGADVVAVDDADGSSAADDHAGRSVRA
ncbi:hypothetical protein OG698_02455 [Streptomyces sp. NBC_01003]|uniref:hypothetical protein n=1 Tax=Streptomyces sp. NBC_01003 TaxID=2903714 RepID=UPI00386E83CC|nr:hypothetical protein OG698_02455 [Streptomyces sp. NBC_01003]